MPILLVQMTQEAFPKTKQTNKNRNLFKGFIGENTKTGLKQVPKLNAQCIKKMTGKKLYWSKKGQACLYLNYIYFKKAKLKLLN